MGALIRPHNRFQRSPPLRQEPAAEERDNYGVSYLALMLQQRLLRSLLSLSPPAKKRKIRRERKMQNIMWRIYLPCKNGLERPWLGSKLWSLGLKSVWRNSI